MFWNWFFLTNDDQSYRLWKWDNSAQTNPTQHRKEKIQPLKKPERPSLTQKN